MTLFHISVVENSLTLGGVKMSGDLVLPPQLTVEAEPVPLTNDGTSVVVQTIIVRSDAPRKLTGVDLSYQGTTNVSDIANVSLSVDTAEFAAEPLPWQ